MAGWSSSTQKANWMFRTEDLQEMRRVVNERGVARVMELHSEADHQAKLMAMLEDGSEQGNGEGENAGGKKRKNKEGGAPEPLTAEEERLLCTFYEWKIIEVCKAFHFPPKIQSTAMQYFKRFYLKHSVMEFEPKSIMLTVVFVACKIDESYVSADALGRGINQDPQLVLNNELAVYQALDFDLIIHGPYKPLRGFLNDWKQQNPALFTASKAGGVQPVDEIRGLASAKVLSILTTDAPLLFPPAQLSLAALTLAFAPGSPRQELMPHFKEYMASIAKRTAHGEASLEEAVQLIVEMAEKEGVRPDESRVKKIDKKLRQCRDPAAKKKDGKKKEQKQAKKAQQ